MGFARRPPFDTDQAHTGTVVEDDDGLATADDGDEAIRLVKEKRKPWPVQLTGWGRWEATAETLLSLWRTSIALLNRFLEAKAWDHGSLRFGAAPAPWIDVCDALRGPPLQAGTNDEGGQFARFPRGKAAKVHASELGRHGL